MRNRGLAAVLEAVPEDIPPAVDSLEPKLRELFHGLEVDAGVF